MLFHGKRIENRRWNTHFRGEFLIHAAKGMTRDEYDDALDMLHLIKPSPDPVPFVALKRGGIVGIARLIEVVEPTGDASALVDEPRWHMSEQFGFVLTDVRPVTFMPWVGALGFFDVPDRVLRDVGLEPVPMEPT